MAKIEIFDDPRMDLHYPGDHHPDHPERARSIRAAIDRSGIPVTWQSARPATTAELLRFHSQAYLSRLGTLENRCGVLDGHTELAKGSHQAAYLAAGAAIQAVDAALSSPNTHAVALTRPSGHHAEPERSLGHCILNNPAIALQHAIDHHGLQRILVIDWDLHHGNGIQKAYYQRKEVCLLDLHLYPSFPGTGILSERGEGEGLGTTFNIPMPAGAGDGSYIETLKNLLPSLCEHYKPELIMIIAGYGSHGEDPVGAMNLTTAGYHAMASLVAEQAALHCDGRVVMTLEGGFNPQVLGECVVATMAGLSGRAASDADSAPDKRTWSVLAPMLNFHQAMM